MGSGVIRKINKLSTVSLIFSIKLKCQYYYMGVKYRAMNVQVIERIHLKLLKQLCKLKKLYSIKYGLWRNLRVSLICQYLFQNGFILSQLPLYFTLPIHPSFHLLSILFLSSAAASIVIVQILQIPQNSCLYTVPLEKFIL